MAKRTELTTPGGTAPATIADLPQEDRERIKRYQASAQAKNTSAAYGAQLRLFKAWCKGRGFADAPPVAPAIVASWLVERADAGNGRSPGLSVANGWGLSRRAGRCSTYR
jgi:hypothetical protein